MLNYISRLCAQLNLGVKRQMKECRSHRWRHGFLYGRYRLFIWQALKFGKLRAEK
jgi:hypothetical protein